MNKNESTSRYGPLVGAIDEGTSSARFLVFAADTAEVLTYHQVSISQSCPKEGWVEQDPTEILGAVRECLSQTVFNLRQLTIDPSDIVAIGITNQRETTVVWDSVTGEPLYNALAWMDMRSASIVDGVLKKTRNRNKDYLKPLCGLPISPYFSAPKLKWLLENVPRVREALDQQRCMFGTIDSWLIWNLTGGTSFGVHATDVTNASRTMLMNIATLKWDPTLLSFFDIPPEILPEIRSSSEIYGYIRDDVLSGVPISGCLGDQQSALVGQTCLQKGQAKSTYGTGCFLLYNTGTAIVDSSHGLLTTVAYQLGPQTAPVYALEGSVAVAGGVVRWLKDNLGTLSDVRESESLVEQISTDENRVTFVPAFAGLYAPYWRKDARSVICGITEDTNSTHVTKAALQAVCFQTRDVLEAMRQDTGLILSKLLVDGAMTTNNLLMQMQADICGIPVESKAFDVRNYRARSCDRCGKCRRYTQMGRENRRWCTKRRLSTFDNRERARHAVLTVENGNRSQLRLGTNDRHRRRYEKHPQSNCSRYFRDRHDTFAHDRQVSFHVVTESVRYHVLLRASPQSARLSRSRLLTTA